MWPVIALMLACGGSGETAAPSAGTTASFPDLSGDSQDTRIPLHRTDAEIDLDTVQRVPGADDPEAKFRLDSEEVPNRKGVKRNLKVIRSKLPFALSGSDQRFRPAGMAVEVGGETVSFSRGKAAQANRPTWRVTGQHVVLSVREMPEPGGVVVLYPGIADAIDARDPAERGDVDPNLWIRSDMTLKGQTRHGITLPAPATATWDLQIPTEAPQFKTWLAMEPAVLDAANADGAMVELAVIEGDKRQIVAKKPVPATTDDFTSWSADLSQWAGKKVRVQLAVQPKKNPVFDWVFMGSPEIWGAPVGAPKHVVVLAMDTTRPDHFGINGYPGDTTPEMDAIGRQSVMFDRAWSVAPRTRPAFRSASTGRLPLDAVGSTNLAEMFQDEGFATAGVVANVHLQPRFDFDHGFDWWHYKNNNDADKQVDLALEWLRENQDRDTFLFLHFMDPHLPYRAPDDFEFMYVDQPDESLPDRYTRWEVNRWASNDQVSEVRKAHLEGKYQGEMTFMSQEIGRLFREMDKLPGDGVTILHTDHGEEFFEHGGFEHNHSLFDEVTRVVLWVRPKGGLSAGHRLEVPASVMDIVPTLTDMLGFDNTPKSDGQSLASWLDGEDSGDWSRPLPVAYLQYETERWGVVFDDHKYILHTGSGLEELYAMDDSDEEQTNLAEGGIDLQPYRDALSTAHGVPVKPGMRIEVNAKPGDAPVRFQLPATATGADVLDPEATMAHRANLEWGEMPKKTAEEVGEVQLSDDRMTITFTPGTSPIGVIWAQFDAPIQVSDVKVEQSGEALEHTGTDVQRIWMKQDRKLILRSGPMLVPPPGEAARMKALAGESNVSADETQLLMELGYIEPDGGH